MIASRALALSCAAWLFFTASGQAIEDHDALSPGYTPNMSSEEAGLWMQVDKAEAAIKTSPAVVHDEKLNAYVRGLICKLAGDYCPSVRVYILNTPEFNASAMPNGAVMVNTGLLFQVENEAQFAFILGHEITHYVHRHSLEKLRKRVNTAGFLAVFSIAMLGVGVALQGDPRGAISIANSAGDYSVIAFSRDEERDADDSGLKLGAQLGYSPEQASTTWRYEVEQEKADPNFRNSMFFSDHPASQERADTLGKAAALITPTRTDWTVNADAFHAAIAPFLQQWALDELGQGNPDRSVVIFRRLAAHMPSEGLYQYGLGEAYRRRNQKNDIAAAESAYRGALACADAPPEAWRGLGLMAMKGGDKAAAKDAFTQYRAKLPDAADKAMIDFYLTQL